MKGAELRRLIRPGGAVHAPVEEFTTLRGNHVRKSPFIGTRPIYRISLLLEVDDLDFRTRMVSTRHLARQCPKEV